MSGRAEQERGDEILHVVRNVCNVCDVCNVCNACNVCNEEMRSCMSTIVSTTGSRLLPNLRVVMRSSACHRDGVTEGVVLRRRRGWNITGKVSHAESATATAAVAGATSRYARAPARANHDSSAAHWSTH